MEKIGIYYVKNLSVSPNAACDCARLAADIIKHKPNTHICEYTEDLHKTVELDAYIAEHIDEALENEYIHIYYQPVIDPQTNKLVSLEALARWIDPIHGFLSPAAFIGVLERRNEIHKLDCYMIRRLCQDYRERMDQHKPVVPVSFNLSRLDFVMCDIVAHIDSCVKEFNVPREFINIEITESTLTNNDKVIQNAIGILHKADYRVWMDDFGSGYSSLNVLKDFDFDVLKIDMAFLSSFTEKSKRIIEAIIDMCKRLGLHTLAEGVETEEHVAFLQQAGCELLQGYYYGKPAPYDATISAVLEKGIHID